jgi:hypothetical protein
MTMKRFLLHTFATAFVAFVFVFLACNGAPTPTLDASSTPSAEAPPKFASGNFAYPVGPAGGALCGDYPNPTLCGAAGGALNGFYPNPGLAADAGGGGGPAATIGLCSARPTATGSGHFYMCTDFPVKYFDDPTSTTWKTIFNNTIEPTPPASGSFTIYGSLALTYFADVFRVSRYNNSSSVGDMALIHSTGMASNYQTPWEFAIAATWNSATNVDYPELGVGICNGIGIGNATCWGQLAWSQYSGPQTGLHAVQYRLGGVRFGSSSGSGDFNEIAGQFSGQSGVGGDGAVHLRMLMDGVVLHWQTSSDGYVWQDWFAAEMDSTVASLDGGDAPMQYYGIELGNEYNTANSWGSANVYEAQFNISGASLNVPQCTITNATNATPIVLTVGAGCGAITGDLVAVQNVVGTTNANSTTCSTGNCISGSSTSGSAIMVTVSGTSITEVNSSGNAPYTSGGTLTVISR